MAELWVKCHSALTKGSKRALPRATRFVFLELLLEARDLDGSVEIRSDLDVPAAIYDLIGGSLGEIAEAMSALSAAGMVVVEQTDGGRFVTVPSWERWNRTEPSTGRVKRHREMKRTATFQDVSPVSGCNKRNALEERRVEEIRGEERESAPVATPPPPAAPMSANAKRVADQIASHRDLFAALTPAEVAPFVGRIDRELGKLERVDVWVDLESEVDSWVGYARGKSEERSQTPTQLLGLVENLARTRCRERPAKARIEREKRRDEQARATTWPDGKAKSPATLETFSLADEIAAADAKLAADRRKAAAEPKADPNSMRGLVGEALSRFKRRAV